MEEIVVFDPALLIWDLDDFRMQEHEYWALVDELMVLFELLDEAPCSTLLSATLAGTIIESFPADQLSTNSTLRDFVRAAYAFLSRFSEQGQIFRSRKSNGFVPDLPNRTHFSDSTTEEIAATLTYAIDAAPPAHVVSHQHVWNHATAELVEVDGPGKTLVAWLGLANYELFRNSFRRLYEAYEKHHPKSGYGSRLPDELTAEDIQTALDSAVALTDERCLLARCSKDGTVLVFRRHLKNRYHVYPITPTEYSRMGINPGNIPTV